MTSASVALSARMVFSDKSYGALAAAVAVAFWIIFNLLDGLLFFSPIVNFYYPIPQDAVPGFILSNVMAPLLGVVVSMNVYVFRNSREGMNKSSFFFGSALGTVSSMCAGCSSVGFYLATTFGAAGVAASSFMSNYQLPLGLLALGLLVWAYYSAHRRITKSCALPPA
ncbi:MAG TPA: hypothetical protein VD736_10540 [Nitrososphaera sp.]|nr:hypothetical protein [Nitrososphaera sp.]